ncbi:MAG TPA: hypothetical protein VHH88_05970 [Verrucomicrobiae bacterium]|nr:hypothetical protein [Verrucomicrobiae bacterium]
MLTNPESIFPRLLRRAVCALAGSAFLLAGCSKPAPPASNAEAATAETHASLPTTNGAAAITLDSAGRENMGLQSTALQGIEVSPRVTAYGRVLDPAPLGAAVADLAAARAASEASKAELERLKTLAAQNNTSARALETGEANAARDKALAQAASLRLLSAWGTAIATRTNLAELVQMLAAGRSALVELNLIPGEAQTVPGAEATITTDGHKNPFSANILGPAPMVDPQLQSRGLLLLVSSTGGHLSPGMAVTGSLAASGKPETGVAVPDTAVLHYDGADWVYVESNPTSFERRRISLERSISDGWLVIAGLKPGEKVVTVGGQSLLSSELKGSETPE